MRVLFRPDLGPAIGSGHAMRDLAIAESLVEAGDEVLVACDTTGLAWVETAIVGRGCRLVAPAGSLGDLVDTVGPDAVVVDSYTLPTPEYDAVRTRGVPLVAVVDGERRGAVADVLVDPGPALPGDWAADRAAGQRVLHGADLALVRREFRHDAPADRPEHRPLRVLVTFGGTDAYGVAPATAAAVLALGEPVDLTVVVRDALREQVADLAGHGQRVTPVAPGAGFPDLVRAHDLVVSAAGSTTWELLAMGAATGLVCVADNQERYYAALSAAGAAVAVGTLDDVLTGAPSVGRALRPLVADAALRARLRAAGPTTVDGHGGERVAAEIRRLVRSGSSPSGTS